MCGIVGRAFRRAGLLSGMTERELAPIAHRGPDGGGVFTNDYIEFGHTRLAIIDLTEAGHQPMSSHEGRYVVTYNGEIYNHVELRAELENLGERFNSHSDTEVLLAAYNRWGKDCVKHFRGMFAFALWDNVDKTLFLARDRCGEKPLFYHRNGDRLVFSSELKGLVSLLDNRPALDPAVVDMYLHYQYVPEPFTLLAGVYKLPAAHTLLMSSDKWLAEPQRYWDIEDVDNSDPVPSDMPGVLAEIRNRLEDAVTMTLRADVPVAVALSGGIDSGAIATLAQKNYPEPMHAFCVGYPGRPPYDERHQARALAESLGMIVHEVELPVESFVDFFPELARIMDEPIADPAAFGHYSVPRAAAEQGIKVLLSGIGGDEVFWGYSWVAQTATTNQLLSRIPSLRALSRWAESPQVQKALEKLEQHQRVPAAVKNWAGILREIGDTLTPATQLRFYTGEFNFRDTFRLKPGVYGQAMHAVRADNPFRPAEIGLRTHDRIPAAIIRMLFDTWLVSNSLTLGDRVSMSVGVESRLPFLDVRLIERVMALRAAQPDHRLGQKAWLRAALKGVLPDDVLARPKAGFQPPVNDWLMGVISTHGAILHNGELVAEGILSAGKIHEALTITSRQGWSGLFFVYKLVLLEMWYRKVVAA